MTVRVGNPRGCGLVNTHWLPALEERRGSHAPACSPWMSDTILLVDDPGNENGVSTQPSRTGWGLTSDGWALCTVEQPHSLWCPNRSNFCTLTHSFSASPSPSYWRESQEPGTVSTPFPESGITLLSLCWLLLISCGLLSCLTALQLLPQVTRTLVQPPQSNKAVSWWRPDSDEFSRSLDFQADLLEAGRGQGAKSEQGGRAGTKPARQLLQRAS